MISFFWCLYTVLYLYIFGIHTNISDVDISYTLYNLKQSTSDACILAENLCLLDGTRPVDVPIVADDHPLIHHNDLLAHLFDALSKSQGMVALTICPAKDNTISALLKSTFPAIKSTNNLPTPFVSPTTIAYIHGLIIDSVTALHDSTTQRALRCETMARQELESMPLAEFHEELGLALTSYY